MPNASATPDRCMTPRQVAVYWRTSPARVRDLVRRGILRAFVIGRHARISPGAVAEAERLLAAPAVVKRATRTPSGIAPEVAKLLER
jgi:excisionase family DNA binding protein